MRDVLMVRFGEIHLKGLNRPFFINKLLERVKAAAKPFGGSVKVADGHLYVSEMSDTAACEKRVAKVFGVHSLSRAIECDKTYADILEAALRIVNGRSGTFKVKARRSDKLFPMDSQEINVKLGGDLLDANPNLKVDVVNPSFSVSVEVREHAYVYADATKGAGGLPIGVSGRAMLMLSGGIDSPVAGYQIAKRGVALSAVYFDGFPYTSERARNKVATLASLLEEYAGHIRLYAAPFTPIQQAIKQNCDEGLTTVIMRRFMVRVAEELARREKASAIVTGESLGQVASQTMEAIVATDAVSTMPIFRPLIGTDKLDIIRMAEAIGTYETSILPYEDCCSIFTPKHPTTKPRLKEIIFNESKLDVQALTDACVAGAERLER